MKIFDKILLSVIVILTIGTAIIRFYYPPLFPKNISDSLTIIFLLLSYLFIFWLGLDTFQQTLEEENIRKNKFVFSQFLMFIGLAAIFFLGGITTSLGSMKYFEMGSYSLIITPFIFGYLNNKENTNPKKICLLTLASSFIFFIFGIVLFLNEITKNLTWFVPIQDSGFFLGAYNLLFSVILLFEYFIKEWKI